MNVYDFDGTIYDGESPFDFFLFCIKKKKSLLCYLPVALWIAFQYKRCKLDPEKVEQLLQKAGNIILKYEDDLKSYVGEFWDIYRSKLKPSFLKQLKHEDVIISASPLFLLNEIKDELKVDTLICTEIDFKRAKFVQLCYREYKVPLFQKYFKNTTIEQFYTDSWNDLPMMKLAKYTYFVCKKGNLKKLVYNKDTDRMEEIDETELSNLS